MPVFLLCRFVRLLQVSTADNYQQKHGLLEPACVLTYRMSYELQNIAKLFRTRTSQRVKYTVNKIFNASTWKWKKKKKKPHRASFWVFTGEVRNMESTATGESKRKHETGGSGEAVLEQRNLISVKIMLLQQICWIDFQRYMNRKLE